MIVEVREESTRLKLRNSLGLGHLNNRSLDSVNIEKVRSNERNTLMKFLDCVIRKRGTKNFTKSTDDGPIVASLDLGRDSLDGALRATLSVHVCSLLLSVSEGRKDNIGILCANITVRALINNESVLGDNLLEILVISVEEIHELSRLISNIRTLDETDILSSNASSRSVKNVHTSPRVSLEVGELGGHGRHESGHGSSVLTHESTLAKNDNRLLGLSKLLGHGVLAINDVLENAVVVAHPVAAHGEISLGTDSIDGEVTVEIVLTDASSDDRSLHTRVGTNKENAVSLVNVVDSGIEEILLAEVNREVNTISEGSVRRAKLVEEILKDNKGLGISEVTSDGLDLVRGDVLGSLANSSESLSPRDDLDRTSLRVTHQRLVETLVVETFNSETGLIGNPLFVDLFVKAGKNTEGSDTAEIKANVGANSIHNIDGVEVAEFPRTSLHSVVLGSKSTDRAKVDDVTGHFGIERLRSVSTDFRSVTTTSNTKRRNTSDFLSETDATSAVNATSHHGSHNGTDILILNSALDFTETRAIRTVIHRLILEVTLTTLIANRAIKRVIGKDEFENTLTSLLNHGGIGLNAHVGHDRVSARSDRLGNLLNLD